MSMKRETIVNFDKLSKFLSFNSKSKYRQLNFRELGRVSGRCHDWGPRRRGNHAKVMTLPLLAPLGLDKRTRAAVIETNTVGENLERSRLVMRCEPPPQSRTGDIRTDRAPLTYFFPSFQYTKY